MDSRLTAIMAHMSLIHLVKRGGGILILLLGYAKVFLRVTSLLAETMVNFVIFRSSKIIKTLKLNYGTFVRMKFKGHIA